MQKEGEEEKKERIRMRRRKDNQQRKSQKREPMSAKGLGTGADFLMNEKGCLEMKSLLWKI